MPSESKRAEEDEEEEKGDDGAAEECWGDPEINLVLKEAAASWLADKGYKEELASWMDTHAGEFDEYVGLELDECEHKLNLSNLHAEFLSIFERQITKFVRREGYGAEDFFAECKAAMDDFGCALFEEHEDKWFVTTLLSATDYNEWFKMMVSRAEEMGSRK